MSGGWHIRYDGWDAHRQPLREALFTLGNGTFCTRGAFEWARADGPNYPGTYLAGGYNRLESQVAGRTVENEDLVNLPNWLALSFRPEGGGWLDLDEVQVLELDHVLDMRRGVIERRVRVVDEDDRETSLVSRRLVSMAAPHVAAIEWELVPENWSGIVHVRSALDARVENAGVERYRRLRQDHLVCRETGCSGEDVVWLVAEMKQSRVRVAEAARTHVDAPEEGAPVERRTVREPGYIGHELSTHVERGRALRVEKVVTLYSSRDRATSEPAHEARRNVADAPGFADLAAAHHRAWRRLWERCDIDIAHASEAQSIARLHIFHLLQTVSLHSVDLDVGVPARGWHGEAYRGHVFWDELFIFPFLNLHVPEVSRGLLLYRYRRLPEARRLARHAGCQGAAFPWQSGSNGREESQTLHLNPRSDRWLPDHTHLQRHVSAAVAYNVWEYYQITGDAEFLSVYGAEMILEIARFWSSIARLDEARGRYRIRGVVGPDEYHDAYPDADEPGLVDNAYTNVMAVWVLRCALELLDTIELDRRAELTEDLGITDDELARWRDITRRMRVPFHDGIIISQFDGYADLEELDWDHYQSRYGADMRLDRILEAEDDTPNRYKAGKQPDVLMLFYLLSAGELTEIFHDLGYAFDAAEVIPENVRYYSQRTSHGSTLSRVVHSWVLARSHRAASWRHFEAALRSDVEDIQGGTTAEGIHLGAMAGTVDLLQRNYAGIEPRHDVLWLDPRLPGGLDRVHQVLRYRGTWLALTVTQRSLSIEMRRSACPLVRIGVRDEVCELRPGERFERPL